MRRASRCVIRMACLARPFILSRHVCGVSPRPIIILSLSLELIGSCTIHIMRGLLLFVVAAVLPAAGQSSSADLFESKIRPVLAAKCYACHSSKLKSPARGLVLDTKAGLEKGGASGPVVIARRPGESRLLRVLRYTDTKLQMPPNGKLPDETIEAFAEWIASGAVDPRVDSTPGAAPSTRTLNFEKGRTWWAFQPVREMPPPEVAAKGWPRTKIDSFILARLEENKLVPSPPADARTLIRRASLDICGLAPTYDEVERFTSDASPQAYEKLIERLLASPHYGERWGRYWLDVARYAE